MMPCAVVVLFERARERRVAAERARRLADSASDAAAVERIERYAKGLEQTASDLEARASALAETAARAQALNERFGTVVAGAQAGVATIRVRLGDRRAAGTEGMPGRLLTLATDMGREAGDRERRES